MPPRYRDRTDAGRKLADALARYAGRDDVIVLGLPRGGVPVAREVARALETPLDVFVVRKLGVPAQPELAMGAIATGGTRVLNPEVVDLLGLSDETIERVARTEREELERRERTFRGDRPPPRLTGRTVILVDDGLATGATMRAAVDAAVAQDPARVVVAVPVGPPSACNTLDTVADEVVCLARPESFLAVGTWYDRFEQLDDAAVAAILRDHRAAPDTDDAS